MGFQVSLRPRKVTLLYSVIGFLTGVESSTCLCVEEGSCIILPLQRCYYEVFPWEGSGLVRRFRVGTDQRGKIQAGLYLGWATWSYTIA